MFGFIIWALLVATTLTAGAYALDAGFTADRPVIGRHRKHIS